MREYMPQNDLTPGRLDTSRGSEQAIKRCQGAQKKLRRPKLKLLQLTRRRTVAVNGKPQFRLESCPSVTQSNSYQKLKSPGCIVEGCILR